MHGKLARLARVYGFNTIYFSSKLKDSQILERLKSLKGVFITSDKELLKRASKLNNIIVIYGRAPLEQLLKEASKYLEKGPSRCAYCNTPLEIVSKDNLPLKPPEKVLEYHKEFFYCPKCNKLYWKGSHWRNMEKIFKKIKD